MVRLVLVAIRRKHITSLTLSLPVSRFVGAIVGSNNKPEGVIMRLYESVFIARQDITAAQVETMADEFAEIITSAGGSIKNVNIGVFAPLPTGSKEPEGPLCHVQPRNRIRSA